MNKKLWNKLNGYQQSLWTTLNKKFLQEIKALDYGRLKYLKDPRRLGLMLDAMAHNLALIAVWEIGGYEQMIPKGIKKLEKSNGICSRNTSKKK